MKPVMNETMGKGGDLDSVTVVGCGGNIGSHATPHLGRMPAVKRVVVVDRDRYEEKNRSSQDITADEVGQPKVRIQARRLRRINPSLAVETWDRDVRDVPWGRLRAGVILSCLDSRQARRWVNQVAMRLGLIWIDAGVHPDGLLVRVNVYRPGRDAVCLECPWGEADYAILEQEYRCSAGGGSVGSTNGPSALGALAASMMVIELQKILAGDLDRCAVGRQVLIDARHHVHSVTRLVRNPACRCDHEAWGIHDLGTLSGALTLGLALDRGGDLLEGGGAAEVAVLGKAFVRQVACTGCGRVRDIVRLEGRLRRADRRCGRCGGATEVIGFATEDALSAETLPKSLLSRPLSRLGFEPGDVFDVRGPGGVVHFEITGDRA